MLNLNKEMYQSDDDKHTEDNEKQICEGMQDELTYEQSPESNDKTFNNLHKISKYSTLFSSIIRSFEDNEIGNNFRISYYDQRIYGVHKTNMMKRRDCLTVNLSGIYEFMNHSQQIDHPEICKIK